MGSIRSDRAGEPASRSYANQNIARGAPHFGAGWKHVVLFQFAGKRGTILFFVITGLDSPSPICPT